MYEQTLQPGASPSVFGFTGEPTDDNGLVYLRARYYNPALGVFMELDPLEGRMDVPMSLNRYMYVQGNVTTAIDPSGMIHETPGQYVDCSGHQFARRNCSCYSGADKRYPRKFSLPSDLATRLYTPTELCENGWIQDCSPLNDPPICNVSGLPELDASVVIRAPIDGPWAKFLSLGVLRNGAIRTHDHFANETLPLEQNISVLQSFAFLEFQGAKGAVRTDAADIDVMVAPGRSVRGELIIKAKQVSPLPGGPVFTSLADIGYSAQVSSLTSTELDYPGLIVKYVLVKFGPPNTSSVETLCVGTGITRQVVPDESFTNVRGERVISIAASPLAPATPGDSGGGVFAYGRLIAVNSYAGPVSWGLELQASISLAIG